jgi:hypothetical protein
MGKNRTGFDVRKFMLYSLKIFLENLLKNHLASPVKTQADSDMFIFYFGNMLFTICMAQEYH